MVVGMAVRRRIVRLRPMEFENLWMQRREGLYADTPLLTRIKMAKRGNMR